MNQPCNYTTTGGCPEPQAVQGCAACSGGSQQTCPPPCPPPCPKEPTCPAPTCDNGVSLSDSNCSLAARNDSMRGMALAIPYVPWQQMKQTYDPDRALQTGTIFANLDLPFLPVRCRTCQKS